MGWEQLKDSKLLRSGQQRNRVRFKIVKDSPLRLMLFKVSYDNLKIRHDINSAFHIVCVGGFTDGDGWAGMGTPPCGGFLGGEDGIMSDEG